ncbi:hypothetical protein ACQP3R_05440 [Bacillus inaquosorum]|uniref:hypothetical protein n=1 Tax=Bacillus inaquosorum TaxID=483913 RepID=UPI003D024E76
MNNFKWITTLFNAKKQPLLTGKKNRGMMWVSLLGLGVSLATIFLRKNNNKKNKPNMLQPIQNLAKNFKQNNVKPSIPILNRTEFSNELTTNQNMFKTQNNQNNEKNNKNLNANQNK